MADLNEKTKALRLKWGAEKELINKIKDIREKVDNLSYQTEIAQREADLEKVAEIKYGKIPELLKELAAIEQKLIKIQKEHRLLKEEVDRRGSCQSCFKVDGNSSYAFNYRRSQKIGNNGRYFKQKSYWPRRGNFGNFKSHSQSKSGNFRGKQTIGLVFIFGPDRSWKNRNSQSFGRIFV